MCQGIRFPDLGRKDRYEICLPETRQEREQETREKKGGIGPQKGNEGHDVPVISSFPGKAQSFRDWSVQAGAGDL
jgi:hypothetical protein